MISFKILHYAIFVIVAIFLPLGSGDLIDSTCKNTPNYQLCVSILRGEPKSRGADVTDLGLIMVSSLKSKSTSALQIIKAQLIRGKPKFKVPLTECLKHYNFILKYDITEAVEALTKGDPKFGEESMNDAAMVAEECEDGFKPSSSPVTKVNKVAHDIAQVAAAIIRLLL